MSKEWTKEEFDSLPLRQKLKVLADIAFETEDYKTLKKLRLKILEYDKAHAQSKPKNCPLEQILGIEKETKD